MSVGSRMKGREGAGPLAAGEAGAGSWESGWGIGLLAVAVVLAYQRVWRAGFVWDDSAHVTPPPLRTLHGLWRIWSEPGATQQYYPVLHSLARRASGAVRPAGPLTGRGTRSAPLPKSLEAVGHLGDRGYLVRPRHGPPFSFRSSRRDGSGYIRRRRRAGRCERPGAGAPGAEPPSRG